MEFDWHILLAPQRITAFCACALIVAALAFCVRLVLSENSIGRKRSDLEAPRLTKAQHGLTTSSPIPTIGGPVLLLAILLVQVLVLLFNNHWEALALEPFLLRPFLLERGLSSIGNAVEDPSVLTAGWLQSLSEWGLSWLAGLLELCSDWATLSRSAWGALWVGPALFGAVLLGVWDDRHELGWKTKLLGQACLGVTLAAPLFANFANHYGQISFWVCGTIVCCNAANTFDNSDGALPGLALLAFFWPRPIVAGALAGFLPFNLTGNRARKSYLGDSGSHLIGLLLLITPAAWPALLIPLVDLLRVSTLRTAAGVPPWRGDRRHLMQRLEAYGLSTVQRLLWLSVVSLPAIVLCHVGAALAGFFASLVLFCLTALLLPDAEAEVGELGQARF